VVLGPVEVVVGKQRHTVPRAQARGVLALLAMQCGGALSVEAIVDALWDGPPPATSRAQVHSAVSAIRCLLARAGDRHAIIAGPYGYRLATEHRVDLAMFDQSRRDSRQAVARGDRPAAARLLRVALDQWVGQPLAGATGAFVAPTRIWLVDKRLSAIEELAELELSLGRHALVADELAPLIDAHPHREHLRAQYLLALYRCGRRSEALASYRAYRSRLVEDEGLDPGPGLTAVEAIMLRDRDATTPQLRAC
jgi:DNA-binding SARP family transcriptional activator